MRPFLKSENGGWEKRKIGCGRILLLYRNMGHGKSINAINYNRCK